MVAWADGVDVTVEVAFASDPLDTPSWTDISAYVRDVQTDAGRSSEFTTFSPRSCTIVLDNNARRFDPLYAAGAYFGDLLPMKRVRVSATYSAVTYRLFTGFVLGWPSSVEGFVDETVTISCVDGSRFLENETLAASAYSAAVLADSPIRYWPLQSDFVDEVDSAQFVPDGEWTFSATVTPMALANVAAAPTVATDVLRTSAMPSAPRTLEMWAYIDFSQGNSFGPFFDVGTHSTDDWVRLGTSAGGIVVDWSNTALNLRALSTGINYNWVDGWHHLAYTVAATSRIYVDGVEVGTTTSTAGPDAGNNFSYLGYQGGTGAIAHAAVYDTALTADQINTHYQTALTAFGHPYGERTGERAERVLDEIAWPAADRDISAGVTVQGAYRPDRQSALGYLRDLEVSENGYVFIAADGAVTLRDRQWQWTQTSAGTFSDDGAGLPYSEITIDANSVDVVRNIVSNTYGPNNAYIKVTDDASVAAYGPAQETLSTPTLDDSSSARGLANYWLRTSKEPTTRVTGLEIKPRSSPAAMFPVVLGLELGDRITVERTPKNLGSQIVQEVTVQGISHSIGRDLTWTTSLYTSPAPATFDEVPYLVMGDATYGKIGAVAGNQVAF